MTPTAALPVMTQPATPKPVSNRRPKPRHLKVVPQSMDRPLPEWVPPLTKRETIVLENLAEDRTLEELASMLFVSRNTVKSQVRTLYKKIGASTRAEAVAFAREWGFQ